MQTLTLIITTTMEHDLKIFGVLVKSVSIEKINSIKNEESKRFYLD